MKAEGIFLSLLGDARFGKHDTKQFSPVFHDNRVVVRLTSRNARQQSPAFFAFPSRANDFMLLLSPAFSLSSDGDSAALGW
jgi:hypothetical protein